MYASGDVTDLDSTNAAILNTISNPTNNNAGCNAAFSADSWVPSNNQNTVSCKVSSGHLAGSTDCSSSITGTNCYGCIDSSQVLASFYATGNPATTLLNDLNSRYNSCAFNLVLDNIWTNYYSVRYTKIGVPMALAVSGSADLTARIKQATTQINDTTVAASVFSSINNFETELTSVKSSFTTVQTLTDPKYGMMAGLNCKLFGDDFVNFQDTICGSFYNNIYIIRLTFGICAWGVLFVMCCSVCAGVRHFKQVDKLKKVSDGNMRNEFEYSKQNLNRSK